MNPGSDRPRSCGFSWLSHLRVAGYSGPLVSSNLELLTGKSWENHGKITGKCGNIMGKMWANMGKTMKPHYKWRFFFWRGETSKNMAGGFFCFPFPRLITELRAIRYVNGVTSNVVNLGVFSDTNHPY